MALSIGSDIASHRDAVVAISYEVDILEFDQLVGREIYSRQPSKGDIQSTVAIMGFKWVEILIEILRTSFVALDLINPDGTCTDGATPAEVPALGDRFQVLQ